jgi:alanyl-tRNA synthetase
LPKTERLYYEDSFLAAFEGTVTTAREHSGAQEKPLWKVLLNRTAFYPTSGGQPFDTGILQASAPDGSKRAFAVQEVEEDEEGEVWHLVPQEMMVGSHVDGQIDWKRRFDHMQQHTGQHLLSAVFLQEAQAPTVSFHLGDKVSTIDLSTSSISQDVLERVEHTANEIVGEDRRIATRFVSPDEARDMLAAGKIRKLPDRHGAIRLIDIADCDLNACGGTHVRSTGQIGGLLVRGIQRVSRGLRVEFACGLRAVRAAREDAAALGETAALLSSSPLDLPAAVGRLLKDGKARAKEYQKLRDELAVHEAAALILEETIQDGLRLLKRSWKDRDRDYVRVLASQTVAAGPATAVLFCAQEAESVHVFLARSRELKFDCGRMLREELARRGLRGGGSADLAQGDILAGQKEDFLHSLERAIRENARTSNRE